MLGWIWLLSAHPAEAKPCRCDETLPARVEALEAENLQLMARIEALEQRPVPAVPAADPTAEDEQAAAALLKEVSERADALDFAGARDKLAELSTNFGGTRAARAAERLRNEIEVIGRDEAPLEVEEWFQGTEADATAHPARLIVFWEVWCPHCRREVPKLEEFHQKHRDRLSVVGLTKLTRDVTEEQAREFIADNGVTYPIAKEVGDSVSAAYSVAGIPAAVILDDGKVVWRGHPAKLTDELLEAVLAEK